MKERVIANIEKTLRPSCSKAPDGSVTNDEYLESQDNIYTRYSSPIKKSENEKFVTVSVLTDMIENLKEWVGEKLGHTCTKRAEIEVRDEAEEEFRINLWKSAYEKSPVLNTIKIQEANRELFNTIFSKVKDEFTEERIESMKGRGCTALTSLAYLVLEAYASFENCNHEFVISADNYKCIIYRILMILEDADDYVTDMNEWISDTALGPIDVNTVQH